MKLLFLITLFIIPVHLCCMETKKSSHKEFITYIAAKVKYQPQSKPLNFEIKETISVKIEKSAKKEDVENTIIQHIWTREDVQALNGHYLLCWHSKDTPAELNFIGYSKLRCQSSNSEPISTLSSLQKSASAKF